MIIWKNMHIKKANICNYDKMNINLLNSILYFVTN